VSVTDRCNFRCLYCMPAEGLPWIPQPGILSFEEIRRFVAICLQLGVTKVRLTGGEPTVRRELPTLVRMLAALEPMGLRSLSMTTNGYLLDRLAEPLAEAGLRRINVSLDTLVREKFVEISRRDALDRVLAGLAAVEATQSIRPIKVNAVAVRGFTDAEVLDFAELARRKPYVVRFIEYMPLDADGNWTNAQVLTGEEIRAAIDRVYPLEPVPGEDAASTSKRWRFKDGRGEMGFINPVSEPFCGSCDRIRITADGQFRTCLFSHVETDFRGMIRAGATDEEIALAIRAAVSAKEPGHLINRPGFVRTQRTMSAIGG
jgi:cyclic pyranopterin phosphate synthase